ncbi:MAG: hypothetical protein WA982_03860 [Rubrobacteraceae bacterium]
MLLDLIRVLFAAILIGVLPGYYWARILLPSRDLAVQLTYGIGLSITLVPAVVLIPASILGLGVTLPATVLSALLVLGSGMVAFRSLGPEKEYGTQAPSPAPTLSLPFLAAFGTALAVAIPYSLGLDSPWVLLPIGVLVVLSGFLYLATQYEEQQQAIAIEEPVRDRRRSWDTPVVRYTLLSGVSLVVLAKSYIGPVLQDWPYVRGVDHYSHAVMANQMLSEGSYKEYLIYPPGFHTMTAMISNLSGLEPIDIFPVLGPMLFLLPTLAVYTLGSRLWGWEYGLISGAFVGLLVGGSYLYFNDSMYPNLVTAQFLLVLTVAALVRLYDSTSWRAIVAVVLLGSSVVLYHQVSSLCLGLLLAMVSIFLLPFLLFSDRRKGLALLLSLFLLTGLSFVYAWGTYDLPGVLAGFLGNSGASDTGSAVDMAIGTQSPYEPGYFIGEVVSQPVAWLGIVGVFLVIGISRSQERLPQTLARFTLLSWAFIIFVGSVTSFSGFPQRFGRDLGVPLSLLAAFALITIFKSLWGRQKPTIFAASIVLLLAASLIGIRSVQSFETAAGPSPQLVISQEIYAAGEWLEDHNTGGNIMVSPHSNQVPSRAMLAMGDYSGLQSFEPGQIEVPRDLPPRGPEAMWDVFRVLQHPDAERTRQLLEKYDIRYIVLYKDMPDRPTTDFYWPLFAERPDLYRAAFENSDVLIVEPNFR